MKFGLFFTMDHYEDSGLTPEQHLQEIVEQVKAAEELGFQTAWFTEQHFNAVDGLCADPITLMSYMAAKTTTIRLGSAVTLAALYHPVHLAEAYALLDVLSGGRIDIGVGASNMKKTFQVYDIPFDSRRYRRDEAVDRMLSLWGCEGASLAQPGEQIEPGEVRLGLYPIQQPHPPIWISTGALDRIPTILACGHSVLLDYLFCNFSVDEITTIRTNRTETASLPGKVASVAYTQLTDGASAYDHLYRYYNDFLCAVRGPRFRMEQAWQDLQDKGQILCCSVSDAQRRVECIANQGLDQLMLGIGFGGAPRETVLSTIETFANKVMPHFSS